MHRIIHVYCCKFSHLHHRLLYHPLHLQTLCAALLFTTNICVTMYLCLQQVTSYDLIQINTITIAMYILSVRYIGHLIREKIIVMLS